VALGHDLPEELAPCSDHALGEDKAGLAELGNEFCNLLLGCRQPVVDHGWGPLLRVSSLHIEQALRHGPPLTAHGFSFQRPRFYFF